VESPKGVENFEDLDVDGRIPKLILEKRVGNLWTAFVCGGAVVNMVMNLRIP
jgi:hypothetical protein